MTNGRASGEAQTSSTILMVRPAAFGFNAETAASNSFAHRPQSQQLNGAAQREFDGLVQRLCNAGVEVLVMDDSPNPPKPDALFPNNWLSFHADGTIALYPMAARSRQFERRPEALRQLLRNKGFEAWRTVDLSGNERSGRFLEGTGSLVLDRPRRRAYAALSPRTDAKAIADFDSRLGYSTFTFDSADPAGRPIYHTNVLMSLGTDFALLCTEAVAAEQRKALIDDIEASGRAILEASFDQLRRFACNIIALSNGRGEPVIALSTGARTCLRPDQQRWLERFGELVDADIGTIEQVGGGGVRCMIADIHLPRANRGS